MTDAASSLRLRAADAEDFRVVAACLQDALVPVGEMVFDPASREFVLVANRYCWEGEPADSAGKPGARVHCAVHFTGVEAVRRRALDPLAHGTILDLLTIDKGASAVELLFAGDAAIRLEGAAIGCRMRDLGEPWPAAARPRHPAPESRALTRAIILWYENGGVRQGRAPVVKFKVKPLPANDKIIIALPNGRILKEAMPMLRKAGIVPEPEFDNPDTRLLRFRTEDPDVDIVRGRAFDVATLVAFGAAHLGVVGNDVIVEFDYPEIYAPLDLHIGKCRLSVAEPVELAGRDDPRKWSHVRVATKYPNVTRKHFAQRGVQAECIKMNGAIELAPALGLARRIVDLVSSGATLKANGLVEVEHIADVTSKLIVNRAALKTRHREVQGLVDRIAEVARAA